MSILLQNSISNRKSLCWRLALVTIFCVILVMTRFAVSSLSANPEPAPSSPPSAPVATTPSSGTLSPTNRSITYTGGPFILPTNASDTAAGPVNCDAANPCEDLALRLTSLKLTKTATQLMLSGSKFPGTTQVAARISTPSSLITLTTALTRRTQETVVPILKSLQFL